MVPMICAIVLAAGRSRRMGTQKLLLPFGGQTVIAGVVDAVASAGVSRVFVVVGGDGERIAGALAGRDVSFVENPDADGEMLSSVRCGWRALPAGVSAVLVVLGDMPLVSGGVIRRLLDAFMERCDLQLRTPTGTMKHPLTRPLGTLSSSEGEREGVRGRLRLTESDCGIVVPVFGGKRGHPILIAARFGAEILSSHDEAGLRGLLASHPNDVCEVNLATPSVLADLDTPEDYRRATAESQRSSL